MYTKKKNFKLIISKNKTLNAISYFIFLKIEGSAACLSFFLFLYKNQEISFTKFLNQRQLLKIIRKMIQRFCLLTRIITLSKVQNKVQCY